MKFSNGHIGFSLQIHENSTKISRLKIYQQFQYINLATPALDLFSLVAYAEKNL